MYHCQPQHFSNDQKKSPVLSGVALDNLGHQAGFWKAARSRNKVAKLTTRVRPPCRCPSSIAKKATPLPVPLLFFKIKLTAATFHDIYTIFLSSNYNHCNYVYVYVYIMSALGTCIRIHSYKILLNVLTKKLGY